jgi:crotonobetainyl-CoA:carnitine CoA-transferase CaiB-like acyl-CoA transferase
VPYGTIYYSKDGKPIVLAIGNDKQFSDLCSILGHPEVAKDSRFSSNQNRVLNRIELKEKLQDLIGLIDRDPFLEALDKKSVPAGGVYNMQEVFELPEAKELVMESTMSSGNTIKGLRTVAFTFNGNDKPADLTVPPHYGEHTIKILKDILGYTNETIQCLIENKVIYASNNGK